MTLAGSIRAYFSLDPTPARKGMKEATGIVKKGSKQINSDLKGIKKIAISAFSGWGLKQLGQDFIQTAMDMDSMRRSMGAAVGSMEKGRREINYLRMESDKLGLSYKDQIKDYTMLSAAAKGGALEGEGIRKVWLGLATASSALQLSVAKTSSIIYAFKDILSKGTVASEEIKRQLGNALPGSLGIAAKAMKMTKAEFLDFMQTGKMMAEDFVPKFAQALIDMYGTAAQKAAQSMRAEVNRLTTAWTDFKEAFMTETGASEAITKNLKIVTGVLKDSIYYMDLFKKSIDLANDSINSMAKNSGARMIKDLFDFSKTGKSEEGFVKTMSDMMKGEFNAKDILTAYDPLGTSSSVTKSFDFLLKNFKSVNDAWITMKEYAMGTTNYIIAALKGLWVNLNFIDSFLIRSLIPTWDYWKAQGQHAVETIKVAFYDMTRSMRVFMADLIIDMVASLTKYTSKLGINHKLVAKILAVSDSIRGVKSKEHTEAEATLKNLKEQIWNGITLKTTADLLAERKASILEITKEQNEADAKAAKSIKKQREESEKHFSILEKGRKEAKKTREEMPFGGAGDQARLEELMPYDDVANEYLTTVKTITDGMSNIFSAGISAMSSSLTDFVMNGKMEWKELQDAVIEAMVNIFIQEQILKRMSAGFSGAFQAAGKSIANYFSTPNAPTAPYQMASATTNAAAGGGVISEPVFGIGQKTGQSYSFGEKEAEVVLNQAQMKNIGNQGTNVSVTPVINISTPPGTTATQQTSSDGLNIDVMVSQIESKLASNMRRGSNLGNSIQTTFGLNRSAGAFR
jgi:tape measure domain-containing protein